VLIYGTGFRASEPLRDVSIVAATAWTLRRHGANVSAHFSV